MKKLSLIIVLLLSTVIVFSQVEKKNLKGKRPSSRGWIEEAKVPQAVKDAQAKQFPGVTEVKWKLKMIRKKDQKATDYVAHFKNKELGTRAHYKPDGTAIAVINNLPANKVPTNIVSKVKTNYPGFELKKGEKIHVLTKNFTIYKLILHKPSAKLTLYVDESGNDAQKVTAANEALGDGDSDDDGAEGDMEMDED